MVLVGGLCGFPGAALEYYGLPRQCAEKQRWAALVGGLCSDQSGPIALVSLWLSAGLAAAVSGG